MIPPTDLTPPTNDGGNPNPSGIERCARCGATARARILHMRPDTHTHFLCDECCIARGYPCASPAQRHRTPRLCACGQPLVSPLTTQCEHCAEKDMMAAIDRAMLAEPREIVYPPHEHPRHEHPRHDERVVLPAMGYVVCVLCGHYTNAYYTDTTPDGDHHFCLACFGALVQLQGRALAKHDQLPPLTDWPDEAEPHVVLMASPSHRQPHGDGWLMNEVSDLLRLHGTRQDWHGHESLWDYAVTHGDAFTAAVARHDLLVELHHLLQRRAGEEPGHGNGGKSDDQHAA